MKKSIKIFFATLLLSLVIAGCGRAARTSIAVKKDDAEMIAAMQQARDHFPEFWQVISEDRKRTVPVHADALVKAYFFDAGTTDEGEHMWVGSIQYDGRTISGQLVDTPEEVRSVKHGQNVSFPIERLSDWLYVENGRAVGAYTVKLLRSRMSERDRKEHDRHYPFRFD